MNKENETSRLWWTLYCVFVGIIASCLIFNIMIIKINNNLNELGYKLDGVDIIKIENSIYAPIAIKLNKFDELTTMAAYAKKKFNLSEDYILKIDFFITKYARKYNIPKSLIYAIIERESGFYQYDLSDCDCVGLMQINYNVWKKELKIPNKDYLYNIENNIKCGCYIFNKYYIETKNYDLALQKYFGICEKAPKYSKSVLEIQKEYLDKEEK